MKVWKKAVALVMALGMTAGFTACGGSSGGGDVKGDELQAGGWTLAWTNTFAATNVTVEAETSLDETFVEDGVEGYNKESSDLVIKLADNKAYVEGEYSYDFESEGEGSDSDSGDVEMYFANVGGVPYQFVSYEGEWMKQPYYRAFTGTFMDIVNYLGYSEEAAMVAGLESVAVYEDGAYVIEDEESSYKFAFKDGYLVGVEISVNEEEDGDVYEETATFVISYGDAEVGDLPEVEAE